MKKVCILLFACLQMLNLTAQTAPLEEEPQDSVAKVQFLERYNDCCRMPIDSLEEKFFSSEWDKTHDDSFYAFILFCLFKADGAVSEGLSSFLYHLLSEHPEEFARLKSKLQYLPSEEQRKAMLNLYCFLVFEFEEKEETKEEGSKRFLKMFPWAQGYFPESMIYNVVEEQYRVSYGIPRNSLFAFIYDRHDKTANIRTAPNGKVVGRLDNFTPIYIMAIEGNWCRLNWSEFPLSEIALANKELWVHKSCVSGKFDKKNGATINLQLDYNDSNHLIKVVVSQETDIDSILEYHGNLVKVKLKDGTVGWINKDNISNRFSD